jgi:hypothetical protein
MLKLLGLEILGYLYLVMGADFPHNHRRKYSPRKYSDGLDHHYSFHGWGRTRGPILARLVRFDPEIVRSEGSPRSRGIPTRALPGPLGINVWALFD